MNRMRVPARVLLSAGLAAGLLVVAVPQAGAASGPGIIATTVGGIGHGLAKNVSQLPQAVATGPHGVVYVGDQLGVVRTLSTTSAQEQIAAGIGTGPGEPFSGDGGPAVRARLAPVQAVAVDAAGNLIVADTFHNRVRVVAATSGTFYGRAMTAGDIYTVAGNGIYGYTGNGGVATSTRLAEPYGVAVDTAGNLVISDSGNARIRVVATRSGTFYGQAMTAGHIYSVAGNGTSGYSGDGGAATAAELQDAQGVTVDAAGNLVVADRFNARVRVVAATSGTFYGQAMKAGDIYTVAGNGLQGYSGDGGLATAAELSYPAGVAADAAGNLVVADTGNNRVRVVAAASGTFYGQAMTAGHIYTVAGNGTAGYSGEGGLATAAELRGPQGVAVDSAGNLIIADTFRVRVVAAASGTFYREAMTAGHIYTIAGNGQYHSSGNGGKAVNAELDQPAGLAVTGAGNYLITDRTQVRMVAATSGTFFGQPMVAGDIYAVAGKLGNIGYAGDGGPATSAKLHQPAGVAVDAAGNLIIADYSNNRVRVVAATSGTFYGQAMTAGDIYTVAGDGTAGDSGDGGPATSAGLSAPIAVAVDAAGNLIIADGSRMRVLAVTSGTFYGQAMTAGDIYTVAGTGSYGFSGDGGPATSAEILGPEGVAVDGAGNLVIGDTGNYRVRVVAVTSGTFYGQAMTAGDIYTVAGNGTAGYAGTGGLATSAELNIPEGVAVDSAGNLVIADCGNDAIRVVADSSGTFYGQGMTAGHIYTVAGTGSYGFSGDGGPATSAKLDDPGTVAFDPAGDLVIVDTANDRVRVVTK